MNATVTTPNEPLAEYRGGTYRLLYLGPTRSNGVRARLGHMDSLEAFWVDGPSIIVVGAIPTCRCRRVVLGDDGRCCRCGNITDL